MTRRGLTALSLAGLFGAATAWALHQQTSYVIASLACASNGRGLWLASGIAALVLLIAAFASWRMPHGRLAAESGDDVLRPRKLLTIISLLAALLFLFAIFLQVGAMFFLPACAG
jgi:hypothetical protein